MFKYNIFHAFIFFLAIFMSVSSNSQSIENEERERLSHQVNETSLQRLTAAKQITTGNTVEKSYGFYATFEYTSEGLSEYIQEGDRFYYYVTVDPNANWVTNYSDKTDYYISLFQNAVTTDFWFFDWPDGLFNYYYHDSNPISSYEISSGATSYYFASNIQDTPNAPYLGEFKLNKISISLHGLQQVKVFDGVDFAYPLLFEKDNLSSGLIMLRFIDSNGNIHYAMASLEFVL